MVNDGKIESKVIPTKSTLKAGNDASYSMAPFDLGRRFYIHIGKEVRYLECVECSDTINIHYVSRRGKRCFCLNLDIVPKSNGPDEMIKGIKVFMVLLPSYLTHKSTSHLFREILR